MTEPNVPDDYEEVVAKLEETMEGNPFFAANPRQDHYLCDFCSKGVPYAKEPRVAMYMSDGVCHDETPKAREVNRKRLPTPMGTYCPTCSHRLLFLPCEGYGEFRVFFKMRDDPDTATARLEDVTVTDVSPRDDGIPWNPNELHERIKGVEIEKIAAMDDEELLMAPENIVTAIMSVTKGVDIREMVNPDGSLDPQKLGEARQRFSEFAEKMSRGEWSRQTFRAIVEDEEEV